MSRRKYLYRVTATYTRTFGSIEEPKVTTWSTSRSYQSKKAAEHRAAIWREGRPTRPDGHPEGPGQAGIDAADAVIIERSAPVDGWTPIEVSS